MILTENAYGKINLYLDVTAKRADGYHEIRSVMQSVSLCDTLTLEITDALEFSVVLSCDNAELDCGASNLICRAAQKVQELYSTSVKGMHRFVLHKSIPVAAGMAGGSTDAAATIRLMNRAHGLSLSDEEMRQIGQALGADVPFCLRGGTALCEGIGEIITPLPYPAPFHLVVAIGDSAVSTPVAFGLLDEIHNNFRDRCRRPYGEDTPLPVLNGAPSCAAYLYNIFEDVIMPRVPCVAEIKKFLLQHGALGALMSGSGPSVFGIFESKADAENAVARLTDKKYHAYLCHTTEVY